jgi:hypothetical protein
MRAPRRAGSCLFALALAVVALALASCGDDDDGPVTTAGAAGASAGSAGITANGSGGVAGVSGEGSAGAVSGAGGANGTGGASGAGGASASFRCGFSAFVCDATQQYCLAVFSELTEPSARCVDVPPECAAAPTCECLNAQAGVEEAACTASMTTCTEAQVGTAGAFTVACRGTP